MYVLFRHNTCTNKSKRLSTYKSDDTIIKLLKKIKNRPDPQGGRMDEMNYKGASLIKTNSSMETCISCTNMYKTARQP